MAIKAKDQVTVLDITDAYSVILTSEAYTFVGNTSGAPSGLSCSTQVVAYQGSTQCTKVTVTVTPPTGIKADIAGNSGTSPTITFTTTATVTSSCEATIAVKIDDTTINKKFSFSVAKQGSTGPQGETGVSVVTTITYYKLQSSTEEFPTKPTTYPPASDVGWMATEPSYQAGKTLYSVDCTVYSDGNFAYSGVSISSSYEAAKSVYNDITMYYRFDDSGQYIGKEGSTTQMHLVNDALTIEVSGEAVTRIDDHGFNAGQITIEQLTVGGYILSLVNGKLRIS